MLVSKLRRKLDPEGIASPIWSVRGEGTASCASGLQNLHLAWSHDRPSRLLGHLNASTANAYGIDSAKKESERAVMTHLHGRAMQERARARPVRRLGYLRYEVLARSAFRSATSPSQRGDFRHEGSVLGARATRFSASGRQPSRNRSASASN